jgi:hypothetical protein
MLDEAQCPLEVRQLISKASVITASAAERADKATRLSALLDDSRIEPLQKAEQISQLFYQEYEQNPMFDFSKRYSIARIATLGHH